MTIFAGIQIPKIIYEADSEYNGKIEVLEIGKVRKLRVDKFSQSLNHDSQAAQKMVWGKVVEVLKENEPNLKNVLILGLGGGTMHHLISQTFPNIAITTVEIDPVMIDVAKKFFDTDKIPNLNIVNADAFRVVAEPENFGLKVESFGAIVVDIYCGEKYPDLGKSGSFISALLKLAIPTGIVVFNRMYHETHQEDVNIFIEHVSEFLNDVKSEVVAGITNSDNIIIFGRV